MNSEIDNMALNYLRRSNINKSLHRECVRLYDAFKRENDKDVIFVDNKRLYLMGYESDRMDKYGSYLTFWLGAFVQDEELDLIHNFKCKKLSYGFDLFKLYSDEKYVSYSLFFSDDTSSSIEFAVPISLKIKLILNDAYQHKYPSLFIDG